MAATELQPCFKGKTGQGSACLACNRPWGSVLIMSVEAQACHHSTQQGMAGRSGIEVAKKVEGQSMLHLTLSKRTNKNNRKEIKTETGQPLALCVCVCMCAYVVKCPNCPGTHSVRQAGLLRNGVTAPTPGLTCFHSDKEPVVLGCGGHSYSLTWTPASCGCAFMACTAASAPPPSTMTRLFSGLRRASTQSAAQLCSHT